MPVDWGCCGRVVDLRFDAAQAIRSEFPAGSRLRDAPARSRND